MKIEENEVVEFCWINTFDENIKTAKQAEEWFKTYFENNREGLEGTYMTFLKNYSFARYDFISGFNTEKSRQKIITSNTHEYILVISSPTGNINTESTDNDLFIFVMQRTTKAELLAYMLDAATDKRIMKRFNISGFDELTEWFFS